jgi:hypothetical protein
MRDEYVIYTAHSDHMGIGPAVDGDAIYNGAVDNASGVAALIEEPAPSPGYQSHLDDRSYSWP